MATAQLPSHEWSSGLVGVEWDEANNGGLWDTWRFSLLDAAGNTYVYKSFEDTIDLDPGPGVVQEVTTANFGDHFLAKYDPQGAYLWHRRFNGNGFNVDLSGLAIDEGLQRLVLVGRYRGAFDLDPAPGPTLPSGNTGYRGFIALFDTDGTYIDAKALGLPGDVVEIPAVAVDTDHGIIIGGRFSGTPAFDPLDTLGIAGTNQPFLAKYSSNLDYVWASEFMPASGQGQVVDVVVAPDGDIVIGGYAMGDPVDFDPGPATTALNLGVTGYVRAFVARYAPGFVFEWVDILGRSQIESRVYSVQVDLNGDVFASGYYSIYMNNVHFDLDPGPGTAYQMEPDMRFIGKYSAGGSYIWGRSMEGDPFTGYTHMDPTQLSDQVVIAARGPQGGAVLYNGTQIVIPMIPCGASPSTAYHIIGLDNATGAVSWYAQDTLDCINGELNLMRVLVNSSGEVVLLGQYHLGAPNAGMGLADDQLPFSWDWRLLLIKLDLEGLSTAVPPVVSSPAPLGQSLSGIQIFDLDGRIVRTIAEPCTYNVAVARMQQAGYLRHGLFIIRGTLPSGEALVHKVAVTPPLAS